MAPEETPVRRMSVLIAIRISVMVSVVPDPPQWPILAGEHAEQREQELKRAARLERTVGEQPMISCGNPEQLDRARYKTGRDRSPADSNDKDEAAAKMQQDQW